MRNLILLMAAWSALACASSQQGSKEDRGMLPSDDSVVVLGGMYSYGPGADKGPSGYISVFPQNDSTLLFYLNVSVGPPSYNSGELYDTLQVKNNQAIYANSSDMGDNGCKWKIDFYGDSLRIKTVDNAYDCGFGGNVIADGTYKVESHTIPEFEIDNQGDTLFFDK